MSIDPNTANNTPIERYHYKHLSPKHYMIKTRKRSLPPKGKKQKSPQSDQKITGLWCRVCGTEVTTEWRKGPFGSKTFCNACGIGYCEMLAAEKKLKPSNNLHQMAMSFILNCPLKII